MTYLTDIAALGEMARQTGSRWQKRPSRELGDLPPRCDRCGLIVRSPVCIACEVRYAYTGPTK